MAGGITRTARFLLERWIQKGVLHQLVLMAALVALVAVLGGLVAWAATPAFDGAPGAVWWAFLRLTDPGYLGDDEGVVLRVVSTAVTVLGYVLFMGSLIAILTQGLARMLRDLESGLTPITMRDHVVVLGWTNRTPEIVLELLSARGRLERFLARHEARTLRVVVLSEEVDAARRLELREYLGARWSDTQVFMRSGSTLQPDHLRRLDLRRASAVIVPGSDFELGGAESTDTRVVKALLTVDNLLADQAQDERPSVVAEVFDTLKVPIAREAALGRIEVIASDRVVGRLVSQAVRHRGVAQVLFRILSHRRGDSIYLRELPQLAGLRAHALYEAFPHAIVLGWVRNEEGGRTTHLDPRSEDTLRPDDVLVLLAEAFDRCAPRAGRPTPKPPARRLPPPAPPRAEGVHRVLALGWSHKLGALAVELGESRSRRFELVVMSRVPAEERLRWLERVAWDTAFVDVRHVEGDYALESDLSKLDLAAFDSVVFLASDYASSSEEADARSILGYVLLRAFLKRLADPPEVLVELLDPDNAHLFGKTEDVYLVTPRILSYLLAHVALRPELSSVFDELFCAGGCEITLWPASELQLAQASAGFAEIQRAVLERGGVALGVQTAAGGVALNPDREERWTFGPGDQVVVLAGPHDG